MESMVFADEEFGLDTFASITHPRKHPRTEVWEFMLKFQKDHEGVPPTLQEITDAIGAHNKSSAQNYLGTLVKQGLVKEIFDTGQPRRYVAVGGSEHGGAEPDDIGTRITPRGEWPQ